LTTFSRQWLAARRHPLPRSSERRGRTQFHSHLTEVRGAACPRPAL